MKKIYHLIAPKHLVLLVKKTYVFVPPLSLEYWNMVTDSINQCAGILLKILVTQWKIQCLLKASYMYLDIAMSILPISDALLIILRLSLNHLTAAPVIATEPCNTTFQRC